MPREIKHVWSLKFNVVNILVIALRYITAFEYIPIFVIAFAPSFSGDQKVSMPIFLDLKERNIDD